MSNHVYHGAVSVRDKRGILMRHRWQRYRQYLGHDHHYDEIKVGDGRLIQLCRCGQIKEAI